MTDLRAKLRHRDDQRSQFHHAEATLRYALGQVEAQVRSLQEENARLAAIVRLACTDHHPPLEPDATP